VQRLAKDLKQQAPSYKVVYNIVRPLPGDLLTLAHPGIKAYSEAFDLVHRREASGPNANRVPGAVVKDASADFLAKLRSLVSPRQALEDRDKGSGY
jgi:hypothetical protein